MTPGQDIATLEGRQFFGYGVDSGIGSFFDAEASPHLAREEIRERIGTSIQPIIADWGMVLDPQTGLNVVAFKSGDGDGAYPTYWGLDNDGQPVCLLTDFALLHPPEEGET